MNSSPALTLSDLIAANASAGLNRLAGFEVIRAADGVAEIRMPWNDGLTQYAATSTLE